MSKRTVFNSATFDFQKHYITVYNKLTRFLKDFNVKNHIDFKYFLKENHCSECHIQISEPVTHEQAKKKLFNCFINEPDYLVESELKANKNLFVPGKGIRNYQFDIFVIHVPNFLKFRKIITDHLIPSKDEKPNLNFEELKQLEQCLFFAVEADGGGHSEEKDAIRDRFFFINYNIVTVRYPVDQLVYVEETSKMKKTRLKYNIYQRYANQPLFHNITSQDIVSEAKNLYRKEYRHIQ